MFYTEAQWQEAMSHQAAVSRLNMQFYDAQGEPLRFHLRYDSPDKQCWSRQQREQEAEHAAISEAKIAGAARGHARRSSRALFTRDPDEGRKRVLAWRQARLAASQGQTTEEGETLMAFGKQPMGGAMKPPKMKMQGPVKPLKAAMPKPKAPKAAFKMPKAGGLTGGKR